MAINIQPPQPGDLITSKFMQNLIDQLIQLDSRISVLEGVTPGADGKLHISRIVPGEVVAGDPISIVGVNFGLPGENIVTFDGGNSVVPTTGNDRVLNVIVPAIDTGGAPSRTVTVAVSGGVRGFDTASLIIDAITATIPSGTISVSPGTIPANITKGADAIFPFTIEARVNMDETYTLTPGTPSTTEDWKPGVFSDAQATKPITQPILISKPAGNAVSSTAQVFVKVTIPQNTAVVSPFIKLDVVSVHNPPPGAGSPSGGSGPVTFTYGGSQVPPQTVRFSISQFTGQGISGDTTTVSMPLPTPTAPPIDGIGYLYQGLKAGQYTLSLQWADTSNNNQGWTASFGGAPGAPNWPLMNRTITMNSPGDFGPDKVAIVGIAGAKPNTLTVTVRAVGTNSQTDYGILNQGIKAA
jgi:hypothetical protein